MHDEESRPVDFAEAGVIWDMDGVLVDTGEFHYRSWRATLATVGLDYTREQFRRCFGLNNDETLARLDLAGLPVQERDRIKASKEESFRASVRGHARPLPGVHAWLEKLRSWGLAQAIASSAPPANIDVLIDELALRGFFDAVVGGDDLPGKPDPAIFVEAARRIGRNPARCVVIEDSVAGVSGAKDAGMRCIAITNTNPARELTRADLVVESLDRVSPGVVAMLLDAR